jgi:hypothetical protein
MANDFEGMSRDKQRMQIPPKMWEFARNILLNRGATSILNESGFDYKVNIPGIFVGKIEANEETVYFSKDGEYSCIGYTKSNNDNVYVPVIRTNNPKFQFSINCPIEGIYTYNYKKELIIAWCDGVKEKSTAPKLLNVHNPQVELDANRELVNPNQINILFLFPDANQGLIDITYNEEGALEIDTMFVTLSYVYADNTDTLFYPLADIAYVSSGISPINRRSVNINIEELDTNFNKLRLGLLIVNSDGVLAYESPIFSFGSDGTFNTTINSLTSYTSISPDELVIPKERFYKIKTMTRQENRAIVGHTLKNEFNEFQKYANLLNLELEVLATLDEENGLPDIPNIHNHATYMPDEVYAMYVSLQLLDGTYTKEFHIPGRAALLGERTTLTEEFLALHGLEKLASEHYKYFHIFNTGKFINFLSGSKKMQFGYWENEETYPNIDDFNSTVDYDGNPLGSLDLRGTPIRYHRMPGMDYLAKYMLDYMPSARPASSRQPRFGIRVTNFDTIVPQYIKDKIQGFKLSFVKRRRGDSIVETNTILARAVEAVNTFDGFTYGNESIVHTFPVGGGIPNSTTTEELYARGFGKSKAYNVDLYKFKPSINPTLVKANYMTRKATPYAYNDDNDSYKNLLVSDAQRFAVVKGTKYLPDNNIPLKTRFTENSVVMQFHNNKNGEALDERDYTWLPDLYEYYVDGEATETNARSKGYYYNPFTGVTTEYIFGTYSAKDVFRWMINATLFNLQKNVYTGFKSNDLVTIGRTTLAKHNKLFDKGGDVFTNNSIDIWAYQNIGVNFGLPLKINGLYSAVNNARIYSNTPPYNFLDWLQPDNTDDLNILNSLDYNISVEGVEASSRLNDAIVGITLDYNDIFIDYFPYRVNRGIKIPNESLSTRGLRNFLSNDYYELRNDRGVLVALRGTNKALFMQQQFSLFVAQIKDKLESSVDGVETYLGESDLFDRIPDEIMYNDNKGYIGCTSQFACIIFKDGYVVVDQIQGKIIIVGKDAKEISKIEMYDWFEANWDIGLTYFEYDRFGNKQRIDNPYVSVGHIVGYDSKYNRLLFTKKFYKPKFNVLNSEEGVEYTFDGEFYRFNDELLDFNDEEYFENLSYTFSFNLEKEKWIAEHDYYPNFMHYTNLGIYLGQTNLSGNTKVYKHHSKNNKGLFFGKRYESYIDLIFNSRPDLSKIYQALYWVSEVVLANGGKDYFKTIDAVVLYTDHQCSGRIDLASAKGLARVLENQWQLNEFRDLTITHNLPIVNKRGEILTDNININKVWFEKSNFINNFIVVRLIMSNINNEQVYIHTVNIKSRISKR